MMCEVLKNLLILSAFVLLSYVGANAQIVDATKKAVDKAKDVTIDAAEKTADVPTDVSKPGVSESSKVGGCIIETTGDVAEKAVEGGKHD